MKYEIDFKDNYAVMTFVNEKLTSAIAPDLKSEFVIIETKGVKNLILNLEYVKFIDSSGLSALLVAYRIFSKNGLFILANINSENVENLINISKLNSVLNIIPNLEEAIQYIHLNLLEKELNPDFNNEES